MRSLWFEACFVKLVKQLLLTVITILLARLCPSNRLEYTTCSPWELSVDFLEFRPA